MKRLALIALLSVMLCGCALRRRCIVATSIVGSLSREDVEEMDEEITEHLVPVLYVEDALDALLADCAFTAGQLATFDRERTRLITRRRGWQDRYSWKFWVKWKPVLPGIGPYEDWPDWDKARKKKVNAGYGED